MVNIEYSFEYIFFIHFCFLGERNLVILQNQDLPTLNQ